MDIVNCYKVKKSYTQGELSIPALDGVDLTIGQGEFLALAGPSGSGKTTLLNIIGGLDRPNSGYTTLQGQRLDSLTQSQLAEMRLHRVGFVFQAYNLVPVLSALENVEFIMLLQGVATSRRRELARNILNEVGLKDMYDRRPSELSGGQQQRVAVARAIVSNPPVVLADEPTANLDSRTGEGLLQIMREMNRKKGVTFIFSTHDRLVMDYADRLIHLRDGRVEDAP